VVALKVCLLVNDLRIGGAERQLTELAVGLDRSQFEPLVVTLYQGQPLERELEAAGVRVVSLRRQGKYEAGTLFRLGSLLRRERVSVIQPFLTPATFFGLSASLLARTPVRIVTERCGLRVNPGMGSDTYRFLEDRLTRFADVAVPNSKAGAAYLESRGVGPRKIRVIYNGVNPERVTVGHEEAAVARRELGIPDGSSVVGIVASLQAAKDHETFLASAALVSRDHPAVHFVIVGDGELRGQLESRARELGLAGQVHFTGNRSRVAPLVASFDVAVLSSFDHEGCSNAILESMGLGRPVVCTGVGGNGELVRDGENGYVVPARQPESMAARIGLLLENPALRAEFGESGRARFEAEFQMPTMVSNYENLYAELWARHARAARIMPARGEAREA
jgi:glycosyltransferase involved in cell wall biosynthesis